MAGDRDSSDVESRASSRLDNHLTRRAMADGGEVFGGRLASRALRAVGARAMTIDRAIVVDTTFDTSNVEDQALYAHEKVHLDHSGGEAGHQVRDGEEVAARAAEAMVFHRSAQAEGGHEGGYGPGRGGGEGHPGDKSAAGERATGAPGAGDTPNSRRTEADPQAGYRALVKKGYSHNDIVEQLARKCLATLQESKQTHRDRHADKKGYL
jgi:hypothetical protein